MRAVGASATEALDASATEDEGGETPRDGHGRRRGAGAADIAAAGGGREQGEYATDPCSTLSRP